jgi:hypothetical protein
MSILEIFINAFWSDYDLNSALTPRKPMERRVKVEYYYNGFFFLGFHLPENKIKRRQKS